MIKINLRHYYPHYTSDVFIEVLDDIAIELHTFENEDAAYRMRRSRNRVFYLLDREDGLEREMQNSAPSSEDGFFREHLACSLFYAFQELPIAQARRIYAHFIVEVCVQCLVQPKRVIMVGIRVLQDSGLGKWRTWIIVKHRIC